MTAKTKRDADGQAAMAHAALAWAQETLGRAFKNPALLIEALTHPSRPGVNYQRLEFLGDRVLGLIIAARLYERFPQDSEGKLHRRLMEMVRAETCAKVAQEINVARYIRFDGGKQGGVLRTPKVLADVCEALIGALYRDGGMAAARQFVEKHWAAFMLEPKAAAKSPKSALQEWANKRGLPVPDYILIERRGPQHAPEFDVEVCVKGLPSARGVGRTKQLAEQDAAAQVLASLGVEHD